MYICLFVSFYPSPHTQSMNFIVGLLLLCKDLERESSKLEMELSNELLAREEDIFWLLSTIVEDLCVGYYAKNLIGTQVLEIDSYNSYSKQNCG